MNVILEPAAFRRAQKTLDTISVSASDLKPEHSVALVSGGAILGFDDQVHIDLNRAHTELSPDEARRFATGAQKNCRCGKLHVAELISATSTVQDYT